MHFIGPGDIRDEERFGPTEDFGFLVVGEGSGTDEDAEDLFIGADNEQNASGTPRAKARAVKLSEFGSFLYWNMVLHATSDAAIDSADSFQVIEKNVDDEIGSTLSSSVEMEPSGDDMMWNKNQKDVSGWKPGGSQTSSSVFRPEKTISNERSPSPSVRPPKPPKVSTGVGYSFRYTGAAPSQASTGSTSVHPDANASLISSTSGNKAGTHAESCAAAAAAVAAADPMQSLTIQTGFWTVQRIHLQGWWQKLALIITSGVRIRRHHHHSFCDIWLG